MKKSELLESYNRILATLKKEYEYNCINKRVIEIYEKDYHENMIMLSEKINMYESIILDISRVHSLD